MAEWWQSPAYLRRQAAGEVVTPGLVDFGGLVNAFNAPYNERVGRLPAGPAGTGTGTVTAYQDDPLFGLATPSAKVNRFRPAAASVPSSPYYNPGNMYTGPGSAAAGPRVGTGPDGNRLTPNAMGYNNNTVTPVTGKFPFNYPPPATQNPAVAAINATVPTIPRGMQINNRSRDSVAFAQAGKNAVANMPPVTGRNGSDIIDLGDAFSPKASQSFADSEGKPVRVKGVVYYPGGKAPVGAPQARNAPATQQRSGGLGGLLGSLFGGGNLGNAGRAGAVAVPGASVAVNATQPSAAYTTTPFQENAFQTTPGALMPASMNNERWRSGY